MIAWLRITRTKPALYALAGLYLLAMLNRLSPGGGPEPPAELGDLAAFAWMLAGLVYGFLRVLRSHPFYQPAYATWLLATPWRPGLPLPGAPALPVWQDAATLAVMVAAGALHVGGFAPLLLFPPVVGAALAFVPVAIFLRYRSVVYGQLAIAIAILCGFDLDIAVSMLWVAWLLLLFYGLRRSIREFPWGLSNSGELAALMTRFVGIGSGRTRFAAPLFETRLLNKACLHGDWRNPFGKLQVLGWPLCRLLPYRIPRQIHGAEVLFLCLITGAVCLTGRVSTAAFVYASLARAFIYCAAVPFKPPITFIGRIVTGRWIIPRHDRIYVAPLLSAACFTVLPPVLMRHAQLSEPAACAISGALGTLILCKLGPSWNTQFTTGAGRFELRVRPK